MSISYPKHVTIVDVSPRDGLQNEAMTVPTAVKQRLTSDLIAQGLKSSRLLALSRQSGYRKWATIARC